MSPQKRKYKNGLNEPSTKNAVTEISIKANPIGVITDRAVAVLMFVLSLFAKSDMAGVDKNAAAAIIGKKLIR